MTLTLGYIHSELVHADFASSLAVAARDFEANIIPCRTTRIAHGRNMLVQAFLSTDSEWLMMLDTDIIFSTRDVAALLRHGAPVACGWYCDAEGLTTARGWHPEDRRMVALDPIPSEPTEIAGCGAGFMLTHRVVFEKMDDGSDPEFPWFAEGRRFAGSVGEDYEFCYRLDDRAMPLLLDPSVKVGHRKAQTL